MNLCAPPSPSSLQGIDASKGHINISYKRNVSAPRSEEHNTAFHTLRSSDQSSVTFLSVSLYILSKSLLLIVVTLSRKLSFSSINKFQTRLMNLCAPPSPSSLQGIDASKGPINISYKRNVSAP